MLSFLQFWDKCTIKQYDNHVLSFSFVKKYVGSQFFVLFGLCNDVCTIAFYSTWRKCWRGRSNLGRFLDDISLYPQIHVRSIDIVCSTCTCQRTSRYNKYYLQFSFSDFIPVAQTLSDSNIYLKEIVGYAVTYFKK